jgi:hypothetical protein
MKVVKLAAALAVYAVLSGAAYAANDQSFSALDGVEVQSLSPSEMNGVHGQLTKAEMKAAVVAKVQDLRTRASLLAQFDRLTNQTQMLALFALVSRGRY